MKNTLTISMLILIAAELSGCAGAAFNRVSITANRHITIGQELIDLQAAHEKGIINDTEDAEAKPQVLNYAKPVGGINLDAEN